MVAPLMRDIKIAANQVAIELAAVTFRLGIMVKKWRIAGECPFFRKPLQSLHYRNRQERHPYHHHGLR